MAAKMSRFSTWFSDYRPLDGDDSLEEAKTTPLRYRSSLGRMKLMICLGAWVLSTFFLLIYAIFLRYQLHQKHYTVHAYETGFDTEFGPALSTISLQKNKFTGNLHFHGNGSAFLPFSDGGVVYTGPPSPEIDDNWMQLIARRYFHLSEDEAAEMWGEEANRGYYEVIDGVKKYVAGLDVMHTLHCVNELRKLLDPVYYKDAPHGGAVHNYHCIDQLRQYLMCYGDLTLIQTKMIPGMGRIYSKSDNVHTCRNFDAIHEWVIARDIVM